MCTVTYIKQGSSVCLTSNRDENKSRKPALAPAWSVVNGKKLWFPQDPFAGGSWFVMNEKRELAVLLNGALKKHKPMPPYRKSRGLLLVEMMSDAHSIGFFLKTALKGIEPFTIVYTTKDGLWQLQWDGKNKHISLPDPAAPHIWSSVTLYTNEIIARRKKMFDQFIATQPVTPAGLFQFHQTQNGDAANDFIMSRPSGICTQSVTQVVIDKDNSVFSHLDLINENKKFTTSQEILNEEIKVVYP